MEQRRGLSCARKYTYTIGVACLWGDSLFRRFSVKASMRMRWWFSGLLILILVCMSFSLRQASAFDLRFTPIDLAVSQSDIDMIQASGVCVPYQVYRVYDATDITMICQRCTLAGTSLEPCGGAGGGGTSTQTTALRTDATKILSMNHGLTEIASSASICQQSHINATVGANGFQIMLPPASDITCGGTYRINIIDTGIGSVTLVPSGSDTIKHATGTVSLTGKGNFVTIDRTSTSTPGNWSVTKSIAIAGTFPAMLCNAKGTSDNASTSGTGAYVAHSSLTCSTAVGTFKNGDTVEVCLGFDVTTGATPPTLGLQLNIGSTILSTPSALGLPGASVTNRAAEACWVVDINAAPGAATATRTYPKVYTGADGLTSNNYSNSLGSVNVDFTSTAVWTFYSQWSGAGGAGTDTISLRHMRITRW